MKTLDYYVLDVFTEQKYRGNQLAVVHIIEELSLDQYHDIAREFGYSETSFIHYSKAEQVFKVRSFTPAGFEVAGAGHNLLGAVCLAILKDWNIFRAQADKPWVIIGNTKIPLDITQKNTLPYVGMKQRPAEILHSVPAEPIAKAVGLSASDLDLNGWTANVVKTEVDHLMIPIKNLQTLNAAIPQKPLLKAGSSQFGFEGWYLFTTEPASDYAAHTRFFSPGMGIDEDPATGTAAGPLTGYLETLGHISKGRDYKILQGEAMGQPSVIHTKVEDDGILISGSSVIVMEGKLYL